MEKAIELEYKNRRIDALTEANEKLEQEAADSLQDCSLDRSHTQLETSVRENQSRIQELVIKLDRQKEQEKKTVAKLKYELQLARESQDRAESIAVEAEAAAAAPPFSIGRSCQTWGNKQTGSYIFSFINRNRIIFLSESE